MNENLASLIVKIIATVVNVSHLVSVTVCKVTNVIRTVDVHRIPLRINVDTVAVNTAFALVSIVVVANQDTNQNQTRVDVYQINDQINHPMDNLQVNHLMGDQSINHLMDNIQVNHPMGSIQVNHPMDNIQVNHPTDNQLTNHLMDDQ